MHHAQMVKVIIDFFLYWPLGHPVIIHVAHLCNENVVHQLSPVFLHDTLLKMPHFIGSPQHCGLSV